MQSIREKRLKIVSLIFPNIDQIDFTGPFEVFSRLSNSEHKVVAKTLSPIADMRGLILTPQISFADLDGVDILHIPGGPGQENIMEDAETISFIQSSAKEAAFIFGVCTASLVLGAAKLLLGRRATTHWASFDLLPFFGATAVNERVVIDNNLITTAGVTAGIDGALRLATLLRGEAEAQAIQLYMEYAPEPPFNSGSPATAPPAVLASAREKFSPIYAKRKATALKFAARFGIDQS